jgi:tRNA (cytidine/uridine-2'-O-)-methyltransferase
VESYRLPLEPVKRRSKIKDMPAGEKLRAKSTIDPFHVVLVEPEIPPNTGAVARTCAATGSGLHLVGTLGFRIDERAVRRAGLDYWPLVDLHQHESLRAFEETSPGRQVHIFSANAKRSYLEADFRPGDALVFGKESVGLSAEIVERHAERCWAVPTIGAVRSLNLSNTVAIVLFEALRRNGALDNVFRGAGAS